MEIMEGNKGKKGNEEGSMEWNGKEAWTSFLNFRLVSTPSTSSKAWQEEGSVEITQLSNFFNQENTETESGGRNSRELL